MFLSVVVIAIFCSLCSFSQDLHFVKLDENIQTVQNFTKSDSIIIVFPDISGNNQSDKDSVEIFNFWGDKATFKNESELTIRDYEKHILIVGPFSKFKPPLDNSNTFFACTYYCSQVRRNIFFNSYWTRYFSRCIWILRHT